MDEKKKVLVEISESDKPVAEEDLFRTTDIDLASVLKTAGCTLVDMVNRTERGKSKPYVRTEYVFRPEGTRELNIKYMNSNLPLDAKTLLQERELLKKQRFNRGSQ